MEHNYTEEEINLACVAHKCSREDAIALYCEGLRTARLATRAEYDANKYKISRAQEYPPIEEYLDGVVKGDQAQIDAYIAACLAVKNKYPKP